MKKLAALVPLVVVAALLPAGQAAAAPTAGTSAVPVRSAGTGTAQKTAAQAAASGADAVAIAHQTKRPVDAVRAELAWQEQVNREAERLAATYPASYSGLRILSHEKRSVWVGFTGKAPALRLPAKTEATVATDQRLSERDLRAATSGVARKARAAFGAEATAVPDIRSGTVNVVVAKARPKDADRVVGRLRADTVGSGDRAARLNVVFDQRARSGTEAASGGAKLEVSGTANLHCTSAFTIIKNGVTGMLTAQHCTASFTHENFNGDVEYATGTVASTIGSNGDLRWYNTTTNEVPQFRADYSDLRTLYTAPGFSEGQWMCHFGYGNGKSCDTVYRIGVSSSGVDNLIAMTHHYTTGGNSGGPWFYGTAGYGVHRGYTTIWFSERAVFTPLNRVWPAFGAYILVG